MERPIISGENISSLSALPDTERVVISLFRTFTSGEKMVNAIHLLDIASKHTQDLTPITSLAETEDATPLSRFLIASRKATAFLEDVEMHPFVLRLKALMSYITLYLTLEYAIVPLLKRRMPTAGPRTIDGVKNRYFYNILADRPTDDTRDPPGNFARNISYGKKFWNFVEKLGVAALLLLAVNETGLTVIAKFMGQSSEGTKWLMPALSGARAWWCFAHAIGPATLRTLFGPRDIHYTIPKLLQQLRNEPLPVACIDLINKSCPVRESYLGIGEAPNEEVAPAVWALDTGESLIPVAWHPHVAPARVLRPGNVWELIPWENVSRPAFEFLRQPSITSGPGQGAIDFFCNFYNQRAILGRKAVPFRFLAELYRSRPNPLTLQHFMDILANETSTTCEVFVFAAPLEHIFCGVVLEPRSNRATIYNWVYETDECPAVKVAEVCRFLLLCIQSHTTNSQYCNASTESQTFVARGWMAVGDCPGPRNGTCGNDARICLPVFRAPPNSCYWGQTFAGNHCHNG